MKGPYQKKICGLFIFIALLGTTPVKAADLPIVNWSPSVFSVHADDEAIEGQHLLDDDAKKELAAMFSQRLHSLQNAGELPFQLKETNSEYALDYGENAPIGLIPIVMLDTTFDNAYHVGDKTYYKSFIISAIALAVCSADEESQSWRMLGTIPLRTYTVFNQDAAGNLLDSPITIEQKRQKYLNMMQQVLCNLDLKPYRSLFEKTDLKTLLPDTYQVTQIDISSPKAQELFGDRQKDLANIIGCFFTSFYQEKNHHIMYPAMITDAWNQDILLNLYSLQLYSPTQSMKVTIPQPKHKIHLDLNGIAMKDVQPKDSNIQLNRYYKAWLTEIPPDSKEKIVLTKATAKALTIKGNIEINDIDIFTQLIISLASDMAAHKE